MLVEYDIAGSVAWARALHKAGVLSDSDTGAIVSGLEAVLKECRDGAVVFAPTDEDIHMAVERLLTERVGEAGARLHTGRSRNDQVATDLRLYARDAMERLAGLVADLQRALLARAEADAAVIVPGYTHRPQAQAVSLSHYGLGLLFALQRETVRLPQARAAADVLPLGAGALAGSGFAVDRQ